MLVQHFVGETRDAIGKRIDALEDGVIAAPGTTGRATCVSSRTRSNAPLS